MATKPTYLHISELTETLPAAITWSASSGDGYELDCVYDNTFDSLSDYTVYRGPGIHAGERHYTWREVMALDKTWADLHTTNLLWRDLDQQLLRCEIVVPQGKAFAYFRIRSYTGENGQAVYSDYLESPQIVIAPLSGITDILALRTQTGKIYEAQISYENLRNEYQASQITLAYDADHLRFLDSAIVAEGAVSTGRTPALQLLIDSPEEGCVTFSCQRTSPQDYRSGFIARFRFVGLAAGETAITLQ